MACLAQVLLLKMEWPSPHFDNGNNGLTLSCRGATAGVDSLSWPQKLVDVGRWKPVVSCMHSPGTAQSQNHHSYAGEWNRHGCGGGPSFRALLFEFWLCLWWTLGEGLGLMVSPCHARSGGRAGFRGLRVMLFSFFV